jgi:hypothetical protein
VNDKKTKLERVLEDQRERNWRQNWERPGVRGGLTLTCETPTCPAGRIVIDVNEESTAVEVKRDHPKFPPHYDRITTRVPPTPTCGFCQSVLHFVRFESLPNSVRR